MIWLAPAVLALLAGVALGRLELPVHPAWSARLLGLAAVCVVGTIFGTLVLLMIDYAVVGHPVSLVAGALSALIVCIGLRLALRWRAEVRRAQHAARQVVDSDVPLALAVPGRSGGVLVTRGLLASLDAEQLQVVFQHEASHLRHRHHRYLAAGALAAGVIPFLSPLNDRLRFVLERWADEEAAEAVGDRALVAGTIALVALAERRSEPPALAFAESWVLQRVEALLTPAPPRNPVGGPVLLAAAGMSTTTLVSAAWQLDQALGLPFR